MTAGHSADDEAERMRRSAEEHRRKAERLERAADAYDKGAVGERTTASVLDAMACEGWFHLDDVRWPGRPKANIDHVVVGPGGVVRHRQQALDQPHHGS